MKKFALIVVTGLLAITITTGCGGKEVPEPRLSDEGVENILVEDIEVEDILVEDIEVEDIIVEEIKVNEIEVKEIMWDNSPLIQRWE